jgi:protease I
MARIAALVGEMFEDAEYAEPAKAFKNAGHEVVTVGLQAGSVVKGERGRESAKIDRSFKDVSINDFDAIFIPGGYSPDHLRVDESAVNFTRDFVLSNKPVFVICHAPQLLITANVLKGRKITGWKSVIQDIKNAGATYVDQEVVEDANIISSRSPKDLPAFIKACLNRLSEVYAAV